mgnify:CR=1 FL=1
MKFQQRHYEALAHVIRGLSVIAEPELHMGEPGNNWIAKSALVEELGKMFQEDNPHFNWSKFTRACWDLTAKY